MTPSWTTPHHKSPLDEINEIRRNAADSLWVLKVTRRRILPLTAIIQSRLDSYATLPALLDHPAPVSHDRIAVKSVVPAQAHHTILAFGR